MKIIVFGGSGFLGSHVADELTTLGHDVTIFDRVTSRYLNKKNKMIVGNVLDADSVDAAVRGQDVVYNFAGMADLNASITRPYETIELNVLGNIRVLQAAAKANVSRFVYASTVYVFSKKGSFYGISKNVSERVVEEFFRQHDLPFTVIRYGSVYGPRSDKTNRIHRILMEALETKKVVFQGNGEEEREYIHVRDAARLSTQILSPEYKNRHIILTGGERFKYRDLLNIITEILNNDVTIEYKNQDYQGHYTSTPYSFSPDTSYKLVANPFIDFGQGLLESIEQIHRDLLASKQGAQ